MLQVNIKVLNANILRLNFSDKNFYRAACAMDGRISSHIKSGYGQSALPLSSLMKTLTLLLIGCACLPAKRAVQPLEAAYPQASNGSALFLDVSPS